MKPIWVLLALLLCGCATGADKPLPYKAWCLGFFAPDYMEVWIETAQAVDIQKQVFSGVGAGVASVPTPPGNQGNPKGWSVSNGGSGRNVMGADLPKLIYVRWQSLAEPQTYEVFIEIPESAREIMRKGEKALCPHADKPITAYRENIGIGLAPGGIAKVWVAGACLKSIEISRVEATIAKQGPYGGKSGGRHRPLSATSKAYIDKFGIPYGSW